MRLAGLVEVVPRRDGDLEPKKASRPNDDNATRNTTEHNHPIIIPVLVEFVKAACPRFRGTKGATLKRGQFAPGRVERGHYQALTGIITLTKQFL
jgi:hypothetical protein